MFLVVLVHTDFFSLEAPTLAELHTRPADAVIRILVESISIVCVNVFIMISGWFGIRPKVRKPYRLSFPMPLLPDGHLRRDAGRRSRRTQP